MAFLGATARIKGDQLAGHVFHLRLGLLLHACPRATAELAYFRGHAILATVFRQLVQGMDRDEHERVVLEIDLDHLLRTPVYVGLDESAEATDAVIDVDNVVIDLDLVEFLEREGEFSGPRLVGT